MISLAPMPAQPEGWEVIIHPAVPAPAESASTHIPSNEHMTNRVPDGNNLETDQANGNSEHRDDSATSGAPNQGNSERLETDTTRLGDDDVEANVKAALVNVLETYSSTVIPVVTDLRSLKRSLDRGETDYPVRRLREALYLACSNGQDQHVVALLSRGVSPDSRGKYGDPCLMTAARKNHKSIVECLIRAGATVDLTDKWGRTSWAHVHKSPSHKAVASILWLAKPNQYAGDIMKAAANGHADEVKSMIERGADSLDKILTRTHGYDGQWPPLVCEISVIIQGFADTVL